MRPIRVAFSGASGTGKSTLAAFVAERYGLPVNPVGSRSVAAAMGFASPYDVDAVRLDFETGQIIPGRRAEFHRRLLADKLLWESEHEIFVVDRTPLDDLLYACLHDVSIVDESMLEAVGAGLALYTHVIYCPVEAFCQVGTDPARVRSMAYQKVYDMALVGMLSAHLGTMGNWLTINHSDLKARQEQVLTYIESGGTE